MEISRFALDFGKKHRFRHFVLILLPILIFAALWGISSLTAGEPAAQAPPLPIQQTPDQPADSAAETSSEPADAADAVEDSQPASEEPINSAGNIPMKWIPNQRILRGGPPSAVSLEGAIERFRSEGAFGDSDLSDLKIELLSDVKDSKKKSKDKEKKPAVIPAISGHTLLLDWGKEEVGKSEIMIRLSVPGRPPVFLSTTAEVWTPNWYWLTAVVIGGIGIFIFGMKHMSEGVQLLAGKSLRKMIAVFTDHRIMALGVGVIVTMLLQSSTVTTVMVIGFVNSQIMTLAQGIGVILGANIGTTVTGWILTLQIGKCGLPILGVSVFFFLFCKNEKIRFLAEAAMGLGLVFFGLELMKDGFSILQELPEFSRWVKMFSALTYFGAVKCALVGCVLTIIMQSSAATIGVTMSLASIGAIDFPTAAALVLGENIGTTLTAIVVSIGASTNARRAAAFHVLFNMIGVFWVLAVFNPFFIKFVAAIAHVHGTENIAAGIAAAHSTFNITNALLFLPFTRYFANFLNRIIPNRDDTKGKGKILTGLNIRRLETPAFAIERSRVEVQRMANGCRELGSWIQQLVAENFEDEKLIQQAFEQEKTLDTMQDEIIDFTSEMLSMNLSPDVADSAREQLRIADELETISDYLITILKSDLKLKNDGLAIPDFVRDGFDLIHEETILQFDFIMKAFAERKRNPGFLDRIYANCKKLTLSIKQLRSDFLKAMSDERFDPQVIVAVNSQLNSYRRLWEHQQNIAESFYGVK